MQEDKASTVAAWLRQSGGNAERALQKYIASFGSNSDGSKFGNAPPCRSYRALVRLSHFDAYLHEFEQCDSKAGIIEIQQRMKPFKGAYSELLSMARSAGTSVVQNAAFLEHLPLLSAWVCVCPRWADVGACGSGPGVAR